MNSAALMHLKTMVERVVRPLPASAARKWRMREELLAHVTAVFEEEVARLGNEEAALERTGQRFGNPDELTGQLLKSLPKKDFAERAVEGIAVLTVVWLVLVGAGELPPFRGRILLQFGFFLVAFIFLADLIRRALDGPLARSRPAAVMIASCSMLLFLVSLFFFLALADVWSMPNIFLLTAALTWGIVAPVQETVASMRSQMEWESLRID